ncbi:ATP-binding protein [Actinoallomurus purpureus]|uniref:ATP-binding protein n=1 Tax=Actinoallomurus purpureus TaxID=478114 RepID=UPI002092FCA6|nr:ATP-binding protein [Actinoallomurus purpureus]MCO6007236.1 ATP-binding protein [Actinoallomurus purpureus]
MTPDPVVVDRAASPTVLWPAIAGPYRPSWIALRAEPESVARARCFAGDVVSGHTLDVDHAYLIRLVVSELATNAVNAARALRDWPYDALPLRLDVAACNRWTFLAVTDPDHRPLPASDKGGQLADHGRGLAIVDHVAAARWVTYAEHGKTVHVIVAAPDAELTAAELQQIGVPT